MQTDRTAAVSPETVAPTAAAIRATVERGEHDAIETTTTLGGRDDPVGRSEEGENVA